MHDMRVKLYKTHQQSKSLFIIEIFYTRSRPKLKIAKKNIVNSIQKSINSQPIRKLENVPCDQPWLFL